MSFLISDFYTNRGDTMTILNRIASNWSFQEREKLNNNWAIIESYLSNLQGQVNILTGDVNVKDIVDQINDILNQGNVVIADLETALQDATTVITNAQNATTDANNAAQDALNAINDMQAFINQFGNAESYDNSKLYKVNNLVEYDGSGFICIKETQGNPPPTLPTKRNEWWQLFAQKGLDGTGAVSKVAGKSPELDGNVPLTAQDVEAVSITDFNEHLAENTWHEVTLLNGWEPFGVGYEPKYTIDKHNNLILKGAIKNGVTNKGIPLFDLGMLMDRYRIFNAVNNNQNGASYLYTPIEIAIDPTGKVSLGSDIPYTNFLSLDEIRIQM